MIRNKKEMASSIVKKKPLIITSGAYINHAGTARSLACNLHNFKYPRSVYDRFSVYHPDFNAPFERVEYQFYHTIKRRKNIYIYKIKVEWNK